METRGMAVPGRGTTGGVARSNGPRLSLRKILAVEAICLGPPAVGFGAVRAHRHPTVHPSAAGSTRANDLQHVGTAGGAHRLTARDGVDVARAHDAAVLQVRFG